MKKLYRPAASTVKFLKAMSETIFRFKEKRPIAGFEEAGMFTLVHRTEKIPGEKNTKSESFFVCRNANGRWSLNEMDESSSIITPAFGSDGVKASKSHRP